MPIKVIFNLILILLFFSFNAFGDPYYDALEAYIVKDYEKAHEMLLKLANEGNRDAQFLVGWMYDYGEGVPSNSKEAFKWFHKAAEQGNVEAQYNIGSLYLEAKGVEKDYKEAFKWFHKAADKEYPDAQYNIGIMYSKGMGMHQDIKEALKWFHKAAEQGFALAQHNIGFMYENGQGVPQDSKEALKWYQKAANQGLALAQHNIGAMYANAKGVEKDYKEAFKWFHKAADQGLAEAQYNIAVFYHAGYGVKKDYIQAHMWYNLAASQGNKLALKWKNKLEIKMKSKQISEAKKLALKWKPKVTDTGDPGSYYIYISEDGKKLHIKGRIDNGIAFKAKSLLSKNPSITSITLDSNGGLLVEAHSLASLIKKYKLNTNVDIQCFSACSIPFIAGEIRSISPIANLGLHQYYFITKPIIKDTKTLPYYRDKSIKLFQSQGIPQSFINKLFQTTKDDMWYPTNDELIKVGVIHKILFSEKKIKYTKKLSNKKLAESLDSTWSKIPYFASMKKYMPQEYAIIVDKARNEILKGTSFDKMVLIMQQMALTVFDTIIPKSSDSALLKLFSVFIEVLKETNKKSPILCMKRLFPKEYGHTGMTYSFKSKNDSELMNAYSDVVISANTNPQKLKNPLKTEEMFNDILLSLFSKEAKFLNLSSLTNSSNYKKACEEVILLYESIISMEKRQAANMLRYVFSN